MNPARPMNISLFPDLKDDQPFGPLIESVVTGTNADLIATVAPLYLEGRSVIDVTYGQGGWWKRYQPEAFAFHDLAIDGVDFRALPEAAKTWGVVCYDPPYTPSGGLTPVVANRLRARYGLTSNIGTGLTDLIADGLAECIRVASDFVLVKCMDWTEGPALNLAVPRLVAQAERCGAYPFDLIVHWSGGGIGDRHHTLTQTRVRKAHSYLIVLAVR